MKGDIRSKREVKGEELEAGRLGEKTSPSPLSPFPGIFCIVTEVGEKAASRKTTKVIVRRKLYCDKVPIGLVLIGSYIKERYSNRVNNRAALLFLTNLGTKTGVL